MKYFLHDTSALDDEKVSELFLKFSYEGVGLFYCLLEKIAKQEKPVKTMVLKSQLKVGKKLQKIWDFMEKIELIYSYNGETFNKRLINFSENYKEKKENNSKRTKQWRENQIVIENVTHNKCVRNAPNSIVSNSNKEENIKEYVRDEKLEKSIMDFFEFTESKNADKQSLIFQFCKCLFLNNNLENFAEQFPAYVKYKNANGFKHSFKLFIGSQTELYLDGAWNAENWTAKLKETANQQNNSPVYTAPKKAINHKNLA